MPLREKRIHELFELSIILKGIHALIETAGGVLLLFVSTNSIAALLVRWSHDDPTDDVNDAVSQFMQHLAHSISIGSSSFAAFYLLSHGIVKMFLVAALLRNKLWAYPVSIVVLLLFVAYQLYRYTHTYSPWLLVLSVFDAFVIWLVAHEYGIVRKLRAEHDAS